MKINIINRFKHSLPEYSAEASAGMDIRVNPDDDLVLNQLERIKVPTRIFLEIPAGFDAKIRSRSGLAIKNDIPILNIKETMDDNYRGEVCTILMKLSNENFVISET